MNQYELMYIISSDIPDSEEPALTNELTEFITKLGGEILNTENLGKKKLAYPIKKVRNAFYILINFKLSTDKLRELEDKVRMTPGIIRHLILNLEEALRRQAKDKEAQKRIKRPLEKEKPSEAKPEAKPEIKIDLDKQIEKALEEDYTK
jgi:small subunit ribosomal protein S6